MIICELLKSVSKKEGERELSLYKRCNFMILYHQFDIKVLDKHDSLYIRKRWRELLPEIEYVNKRIWEIAKIRRRISEWDDYSIKTVYTYMYQSLIKTKEIYEEILKIIAMESALWSNEMLFILSQYKLSKEDAYELMPNVAIESFKILLRQMFRPIINLMTAIENELLNGEVDDIKLKDLEEKMLVSFFPWLERVFKDIIELQGDSIW